MTLQTAKTIAERLRARDPQTLERVCRQPLKPQSGNLVKRPWGGPSLASYKGMPEEPSDSRVPFGEAFEVCAHRYDPEATQNPSIIRFEDGSAIALPHLLAIAGEAILGQTLYDAYGPQLPLLPKTLDVGQLLSVQAHPAGYTEAYIVIEAEPGATLRLGFAKDTDPTSFKDTLERGLCKQKRLLELLLEDSDQLALQATLAPVFARRESDLEAASSTLAALLREPADLPELKQTLADLKALFWEVLDLLNAIPVEPGDILHNANPTRLSRADDKRAAQVHAIGNPRGKEILLLEVRLPAPTFRAWDNVRFPMRAIALDDAIAVLDFAQTHPDEYRVSRRPHGHPQQRRSVEDPAFVVDHLLPALEAMELQTEGRAQTLHAIRGSVVVRSTDGSELCTLERSESLLVPAALGSYRLTAAASDAEVVRVSFPDSAIVLARANRELQINAMLERGAPEFLETPRPPLRFGTSGLRALVADMTDLEVYINTRGFLDFLRHQGQLAAGQPVAVGEDLRAVDPESGLSSSPRIARAVIEAIRDCGATPVYCGQLPTPALAYYALLRGEDKEPMPAIMVTGSHIPANRNGIKFYKKSGEVLKTDEAAILAAVRVARAQQIELSAKESRFDSHGMLHGQPETPPIQTAALELYLQRYLKLFENARPFVGKKIIVYQHSAVGRDLIVTLFEKLGADVVAVRRSDTFVAVDTEDVTAEDRALYRELAREHQPFAVISTDGDSDRPLLIDEQGTFHRGDVLGVITAQYVKASYAAVPISTSDALDRHLQRSDDGPGSVRSTGPLGPGSVRSTGPLGPGSVRSTGPLGPGMQIKKTSIGSPHVILAMQKAVEAGHQGVVGWEANGGFLTANDCIVNGVPLPALPTRDAVLPILAALLSAVERGISVSALFATLPQRATGAGLIDDFPREASLAIMAALRPDDEGIEHVWFAADASAPRLQRKGSDEVVAAEGGLARQLLARRQLLSRYFDDALGFGAVESINYLDGVRLFFTSGEIAHLRPSGNAPQLRIYAVSDSEQRTEQIVEAAIAEPDGLLRRMERDLVTV